MFFEFQPSWYHVNTGDKTSGVKILQNYVTFFEKERIFSISNLSDFIEFIF